MVRGDQVVHGLGLGQGSGSPWFRALIRRVRRSIVWWPCGPWSRGLGQESYVVQGLRGLNQRGQMLYEIGTGSCGQYCLMRLMGGCLVLLLAYLVSAYYICSGRSGVVLTHWGHSFDIVLKKSIELKNNWSVGVTCSEPKSQSLSQNMLEQQGFQQHAF